MKPNQTIPLICGCIALIVCGGVVADFKNIVTENSVGVAVSFALIPLAALCACVYFFVRAGGK